MSHSMPTTVPRRRPRVRLRTSMAAVIALGSLVLTGCGDPDDDDGGDGGGYVTQALSAP